MEKLKVGQKVWDIMNDEVAEVIEILECNNIKIKYIGEGNFLEGQTEICSADEVGILNKGRF